MNSIAKGFHLRKITPIAGIEFAVIINMNEIKPFRFDGLKYGIKSSVSDSKIDNSLFIIELCHIGSPVSIILFNKAYPFVFELYLEIGFL